MKYKIGIRRSSLALAEWAYFRKFLNPTIEFEEVLIDTSGDKCKGQQYSTLPDDAFVKELYEGILNGIFDFTVHCGKDAPLEIPQGLIIGAVTRREDPHDILVSKTTKKLNELPRDAKFGLDYNIRKSYIRAYNPQFIISEIRGNIDMRIKLILEGKYDATILANSGLTKLKLMKYVAQELDMNLFPPPLKQGVLIAVCKEDNNRLRKILLQANDKISAKIFDIETLLLKKLGGNVHNIPVGGYVKEVNNELKLNLTFFKDAKRKEIKDYIINIDRSTKVIADDIYKKLLL